MSLTADRKREFFLLNAVESEGRSIDMLLNLKRHNRKPWPATERELLELVHRMVKDDLLFLDCFKRGTILQSPLDPDILLRDDTLQKFATTAFVLLTPSGGSAWEETAQPNWDRFVEIDGAYPKKKNYLVVRTPNWDRLIEAVRREGCFEAVDSSNSGRIRPWNAKYWKVLPETYCAAVEQPASLSMDEWRLQSNIAEANPDFFVYCELGFSRTTSRRVLDMR